MALTLPNCCHRFKLVHSDTAPTILCTTRLSKSQKSCHRRKTTIQRLRAIILRLPHLSITWDIFIRWGRVDQFHHMMVLILWKISRKYMVRWGAHGITLHSLQMLKSSWGEPLDWPERRHWESNSSVSPQRRKLITLTSSSITVSTSSMKEIRPILHDRSSPIQRVRKSKSFGHQVPMMKWLWWFSVMRQFGKCMRIHGILFQVSCQSECIQITISVFLIPSSSTKWTLVSTTKWQRIRCTSQKMPGHSHQRRTLTVTQSSGDHKKTSERTSSSGTLTGTQKTLTSTSTTKAISPEKTSTRP